METPKLVALYLDFLSPYTWLALMQAERFAEEHGITWEVRPVVYGALLDAHGLIGPVETPAKRRYTLHDVARCAAGLGLPLEGPPEHPFRSLDALRTLFVLRRAPEALRLAVALSNACWGQGKNLTDRDVLRGIVSSVGLPSAGLDERIGSVETKEGLRAATDEAVRLGVFGVPTFVHEGELFWGHDRLEPLAKRLSGAAKPSSELVKKLLERPRGVERKRPAGGA
jgi:2-hydroxychromene-2-carboxylate isomerase